MRPRFSLLFLTFVLLTSLTGFGWARGVTEDFEAVEDRRVETDELVVYTYDSLAGTLRRLIESHFAEEYGVTVTLERIGDTGTLYTQTFLERDDPRADVVIGFDESFIPRLRTDRLFEAYEPSNIDLVRPELAVTDDWLVTPFDFGFITLNYDSEALSEPPTGWDDLLDDRFRNSIIMLHPGTSSPGRNFLLASIAEFGEDGFVDFWEALSPNILTVTGGWSEGYGLYTQGEAPLVISYETSPAFHREFEETDRYRSAIFDNRAYMQIEVAGIVRGARNRLNAERLIDFIVSEEFQREIPFTQFMYPIHPAVELPQSFLEGNVDVEGVRLDNDLIEENFSAWLEAWEDALR
ncbi:MAG: thiamine ABC transporter substrate-binding protein [Spirochaetaceae bacterium]|nr:MAG: thiamine ABC transporter substrate-binding protein [Spirochaetaceae bacterium]